MSYPIDRVQLFDRDMSPLRELAPSEVFSRVRTEEVNGEHALVIVTTRRLEEGWRALTVDGTGKWREWVLTEPDESHESGKTAIGTYRFVWSLQYDLTYSYFHDTGEGVSIGMGSDTLASVAAQHVLEGVAGWSVGPCDAPDIAAGTGCVFIRESAWSKLSKLVECSGVEVDSIIEVSNLYGVTARKLCLRSHVGNEEALLRFDWSRDLTGIRRTPDPGPYYCRVVPLGKGETEYADDDETTYEYPIDITEEPDGHGGYYPYYLQDDDAALAFRIKAGDGTYVYPTIAVSYSEDDPELLLNAALAELHDYTRPGVTYEADVVQLAQAGMDVRGVALGDEVQCVDYGFNPDAGLRIQGRVLKMEVDELSPETTTQLTIGQLRDSMTTLMKDMGQSLDDLQRNNEKITDQMRSMTTARYIDELLDRINAEINATGGYAYFVPGEGIVTYDVAVADPLVGSEATQVVQIKGGSVRIANSKDAQFAGIDDWNWRTVFTANGINADLITTIHAIAGYLGNATNSNYWNLDTGELVLRYLTKWASYSTENDELITTRHGTVIADAKKVTTLYGTAFYSSGYATQTYNVIGLSIARDSSDRSGKGGEVIIVPTRGWRDLNEGEAENESNKDRYWDSIASKKNIHIISDYSNTSHSAVEVHTDYVRLASFYESSYTGSYGIEYVSLVPTSQAVVDTNEIWFRVGTIAENSNLEKPVSLGKNNINIGIPITIGNKGSITSTALDTNATQNSSYIYVGRVRVGSDLYVASSNSDTSGYNGKPGDGTIYAKDANFGAGDNSSTTTSGRVRIFGSLTVNNSIISSGSKSRSVNTRDYGNRLLYCYETPTPMFGDIGSGVIDDSGVCVISIDDVFSETVNADSAYYVFLQQRGEGNLWVAEKKAQYFMVRGTPGLSFDWELKARQVGYETLRLDNYDVEIEQTEGQSLSAQMADDNSRLYNNDILMSMQSADEIESLYTDYVSEIEDVYKSAA